jgi:Carboxypeptidase regulatory-like domain
LKIVHSWIRPIREFVVVRTLCPALLTLACLVEPAAAQAGSIAGVVLGTANQPVSEAAVHAARSDGALARDAVTAADGTFRVSGLSAGLYNVTIRKVGYRNAEVAAVRVAAGQAVALRVSLTQAPRQLSTIQVVASPVTIDATTPEVTVHLDRTFTEQLPTARDASSLIALVPGSRKDQLWGGAPGVSNNYQLDGVSMNHPGLGGDFLGLSVDWIESVDVRGLGTGAESGNFQGGIINAITRTGDNTPHYALRTNYESANLTASNFNANEEGVEQAGRRELSGEALGPIARDRLFYFAAGQYVSRDMRSPDLTTIAAHDFQGTREQHRDGRAVGKLTWLPALGQRVDLLAGLSSYVTQHAGINGVDDPSATLDVHQPSAFYELAWNDASSARSEIDVRVAGFNSRERRSGYGGPNIPAVQPLHIGRQPTYQNAAFDESRAPSSLGGNLQWSIRQRALGADHKLVLGGDVSRGRWLADRTRNGGVTWRPYSQGASTFDPTDASTWTSVASEWGGDMHLDSDVASEAIFAQDYATLGSRVTVTPGLRAGHWAGYAHPRCTADAQATCYRFQAVGARGFDPRVGLSWDVTGRNTMAVKAHWGRYHQGMYALFFDRAAGVNAYTNERNYYTAPKLTGTTQTFTTAQRDSSGSGFSTFYDELIRNESGRVQNYKQPYVDQVVLGIEKAFGTSWKAEVVYTNRRNGDIVGLMDRNLESNYTPLHDVTVDHRYIDGVMLDAKGNPLVLPDLYLRNDAWLRMLALDRLTRNPHATIFGYDTAYISHLTWNPAVALTTVPQAWRHYNQLTTTLRTFHPRWRGEGSLTFAQLKGNVAGVTGYGTTGTEFSAGPFVRRNEAINMTGTLPDAMQMEGKLWITALLPHSMQGGLLFTHILGERITPSVELLGRYRYTALGLPVPDDMLKDILGQTVFVEPRGSRHYASRDVVDTHLEWRMPRGPVLTFDVFNLGGSNALVDVNTNIGDQDSSDPTSVYGAPRLRVNPRTLRVGLRID